MSRYVHAPSIVSHSVGFLHLATDAPLFDFASVDNKRESFWALAGRYFEKYAVKMISILADDQLATDIGVAKRAPYTFQREAMIRVLDRVKMSRLPGTQTGGVEDYMESLFDGKTFLFWQTDFF